MATDFTQVLGSFFDYNKVLDYLAVNGQDYLISLVVFIASAISLKIFKTIILGKLRKISEKTANQYDDLFVEIIDRVGWNFYVVVSLYIATRFVQLPRFIDSVIYYLFLIGLTYYVIRAFQEIIDFSSKILIKKRQEEEKDADTSLIQLLCKIMDGVLWGIAVLLILQNLGYDISALIAGLGIGGLAVAIALQNVLSDIFASFSIYFDKPFKVGDFIIVGEDMGSVKKIGIQTTRLESLWGQEIIISNRELVSTRINNYKRMEKRRVQFNFGVVYGTSAEKMKKVIEIVKVIFENIPGSKLDRVHFKAFGDFSLNFEVVYYVDSGDYNRYMDIQQMINFALKDRFEKEGIEFAYPTQTILLNR
ncbi:MAG: mechanosensitive ion channel family protein [Candidatus Altiarchaeia archaeon]